MEHQPPTQWICDRCRQVIESPEQGMVEWLQEVDESVPSVRAYGLRIIHHDQYSPSAPHNTCRLHRGEFCDMPLHDLVGPKGLQLLLEFLDPQPAAKYRGPQVRDLREWVNLVKRIHLRGDPGVRSNPADRSE